MVEDGYIVLFWYSMQPIDVVVAGVTIRAESRIVGVHTPGVADLTPVTITLAGLTSFSPPGPTRVLVNVGQNGVVGVFPDPNGSGQPTWWLVYILSDPSRLYDSFTIYVGGLTVGTDSLTAIVEVDDEVVTQETVTFTTVHVDINTDSNNDGHVDKATDDPAANPSYEETAPGKIIEKNGSRAKVTLNVSAEASAIRFRLR